MPEIGRFFGIDPISEEYFTITNYQFAHNNPVWKVELEGLEGASTTEPDKINREPVVKKGLEFEFTLGWGKTVGLSGEVLGMPVSGKKDWGSTNIEYSTLSGFETSQTSGYDVSTPIIGHSKETKLIYSDKKSPFTLIDTSGEEDVYINAGTTMPATKETENTFSFMFGTGLETISESGGITFNSNEYISVSKTIHGTGAFPGPFDLSFNSVGEKTTTNNGRFNLVGGEVNVGIRFGFNIIYNTGSAEDKKDKSNVPEKDIINWAQSCFVKGTKILMADGNSKAIEDIKIGDLILSVKMKTMEVEIDKVVELPKIPKKYKIIKALFDNGTVNLFSPTHPYWVIGKGWSVFNKDDAETSIEKKAKILKEGDYVLYYKNGKLKKSKIVYLEDTGVYTEMYNVQFVEKNNTFFANGILVHNRYQN